MSRNVCITAAEGQTGFAIAELLLSDPFSSKVDSVTALTMDPSHPKAKELVAMNAKVVHHVPGREREVVKTLKETGCDTICLIPPAHAEKFDIAAELVRAAQKAGVNNVCLISSVGCDYADPKKQPRLREFIDLEAMTLATKGDPNTPLGHSPVVIRAGFYAENLLLYAPQAQTEGVIPLPIGKDHKFAPVALGDIAQVAAHVLTGKGKHGFDDKHRGQMMVVTGPMLCTGDELATAASKVLGKQMQYEDISESEARKILRAQSESDQSEQQYLLEYYSLVREGKTNYISTSAFHYVTGEKPTEVDEFFKMYIGEFQTAKRVKRHH
ncbi:NAD(P)-binding protein [Sodiomyces alkalinus F11]|uniref:NAD(P)-binding protein n=1 Tax=Sodiomyces alkalinus (strain CBS 110278 / VKM F-3762 / F11) TaxID=1314773 RepID=A0A3N2PYF3_SODAK|nr:NAD(P)-binding protein [Sodiomyces alkalinus F11]ROT39540.1 NAD(P)-binding protein [Sodiomyces alkalinus F11]